ncbi:MAG TPA: hypothetical protein VF747_06395 [Blastocatellia bacterium]|jgi:hypothetical protein
MTDAPEKASLLDLLKEGYAPISYKSPTPGHNPRRRLRARYPGARIVTAQRAGKVITFALVKNQQKAEELLSAITRRGLTPGKVVELLIDNMSLPSWRRSFNYTRPPVFKPLAFYFCRVDNTMGVSEQCEQCGIKTSHISCMGRCATEAGQPCALHDATTATLQARAERMLSSTFT